MKKLLIKPGLPQGLVSSVLISPEYPEFSSVLKEKFDIQSVKLIKNNLLTDETAYHPDCNFVQLSDSLALADISNYESIVNYLTIEEGIQKFEIISCGRKVCSPYPEDVKLNVRVISDMVFCNTRFVADEIKEFVCQTDYKLVHCNQGYTACSSIALNDNAMITDDESVYSAAVKNGIDCLYISKGSVRLNGYQYGFIGGTCGFIDKDLIAFTGNLDNHINAESIKDFLKKHSIRYVELSDGPLIDIGGIIPLTVR